MESFTRQHAGLSLLLTACSHSSLLTPLPVPLTTAPPPLFISALLRHVTVEKQKKNPHRGLSMVQNKKTNKK